METTFKKKKAHVWIHKFFQIFLSAPSIFHFVDQVESKRAGVNICIFRFLE